MFNNRVSPFDLVQMRLIISFLILLPAMYIVNRNSLKVNPRDIPYFIYFGFFGVAAVQFTYLYAISQTNVATAIFLQYMAPALVLVFGLLTGSEKPGAKKFAALTFALLGGFFIVKGSTSGGLAVNTPGLISGLASALSFAFYTVYGKKGLALYTPWALLTWGFGVGALVWSFYRAPWVTFFMYGPEQWLFFLYIAIFATIVPFGFFFVGLKYLSSVKTGITSTLEPVVGALAAYLFLREILTPLQIAGCLLILVAVLLIQLVTDSSQK